MPRIAIFASGSGTTAEALITACASGRVPGQVALIIGNNSTSEVFARAARLAVPARHLSSQTEVAVSASDTIDTLADRVQQAERELLIRTLRTILRNDAP